MTNVYLKIATSPDLVDQVYRRVLGAISDGSIAPGAGLRQEAIAEQLAVSRQPVLQAHPPGMGAVLQISTMRGSIRDEHEATAQAIAKGNADTAEVRTRQHGIEAGRSLASLLSTALNRPLPAS